MPDILSIAAERMLADTKCKTVSWRSGTNGPLKARFADLLLFVCASPTDLRSEYGTRVSSVCLATKPGSLASNAPLERGNTACDDGFAHTGSHYQGPMDL